MGHHRRVLLVTPYAPPLVGGISTFVHNLQASLEALGEYTPSILARSHGWSSGHLGKGSFVPAFILRSMFRILEERPDVVHGHAHWYTIASAQILQKFGIRPQLVFSFHTMPAKGRIARFRILFERLLAKCDHVTFVSRSLEEQVRELLRIVPPASVLSPGVPLPPKPDHDRPASGVVGFAGPLVWAEKIAGAEILLNAFSELRKDVPEARLLLAGAGPGQDSLVQRASELGLETTVTFLGAVEDMTMFWNSIDIYAHISLREGLPLSLLEAMSWGKPVIAAPVGGIPEVVRDGENGILVPADSHSVAEGLKRLVRNPGFARDLGRSARMTVTERFGLENLGRRAQEVYNRRLGPNKGPIREWKVTRWLGFG